MRLQGAIEIRATPPAVFEVLSTPERLPEWNPSVARAQRVGGGPVALGSRAIFAGKLFGQELESETEVVGFEPPKLFVTRAVRGPRLRTSFRMEPVALGTRVAAEVEGEVPGGKVGGFVAERLLRTDFFRSLDQLRVLCEAETRRSAEGPLAR